MVVLRKSRQFVPPHPESRYQEIARARAARTIPRHGVQRELIDVLLDAGAAPGDLLAALAHRELDAAERLLARGAKLTLLATACLERRDAAARLLQSASSEDRQLALAGAALNGRAEILTLLIDSGVDVNAYNPPWLRVQCVAMKRLLTQESRPFRDNRG